MMDDIPK